MTTLISMIGKGKVDEQHNNQYEKVAYSFENGITVTTSCSTNAILKSGLYSIDKVIMIGTTTSSWGELLDDPSPDEKEVFDKLFNDCKEKYPFAVKSEIATKLKFLLLKRWNVKDVSFVATEAELTSKTAEYIYSEYVKKCMGTERNYILDVTHGLRWMPMFLTSAIRYKEMVEHGLNSMRLLYAENPSVDSRNSSKDSLKKGYIRELDALWKGQKTAEAMVLFFDKFDSDELISYLPDSCVHLKEAMENFADSMQADYLMPLVWDHEDKTSDYPLGKTIKQLYNGIADVDNVNPCPIWLHAVASEMTIWVNRLKNLKFPSERLLELADMYAERRLWGQAVLALDVALRIFACEYYEPKTYPNWDMTDKYLKTLTNCLSQPKRSGFHSINKSAVENIMHTRNMIAHGTIPRSKTEKMQVKPNLSKQYPVFKNTLKSLFAYRH